MTETQPRRHQKYEALIAHCRDLAPVPTAVVHPCHPVVLAAAVEAGQIGIIAPILVGPAARIARVAAEHGIVTDGLAQVDVPHSHAAAERAVALARAGEVAALIKGSLPADELLAAVADKEGGIRTERRISHVFIMDVPAYHKPLFITDAAVNILPALEEKADIVANAIGLAQSLGIAAPKVAILSVAETVTARIASTLDAAALCKMAERGQIAGGILDGPLGFDDAISREAAASNGITSPVAGDADILLVPDLEAGNMLAKALTFLANADAAGVVLGARVPITLNNRSDNGRSWLASSAVAAIYCHAHRLVS